MTYRGIRFVSNEIPNLQLVMSMKYGNVTQSVIPMLEYQPSFWQSGNYWFFLYISYQLKDYRLRAYHAELKDSNSF